MVHLKEGLGGMSQRSSGLLPRPCVIKMQMAADSRSKPAKLAGLLLLDTDLEQTRSNGHAGGGRRADTLRPSHWFSVCLYRLSGFLVTGGGRFNKANFPHLVGLLLELGPGATLKGENSNTL